MRKAFDRIVHNLLVQKLSDIGIHSSLLNWIDSYLRERSQYVNLSGWRSRSFAVSSGVPQESHLGPLLFILFINDIAKVFKSAQFALFADDLKLFINASSILDCKALQDDLDALALWCSKNHLFLNIDKCKVITFHRSKTPLLFDYSIDSELLQRVDSIRDLGVLLDKSLDFKSHIENIIAKSCSMLGFVKRICWDLTKLKAITSIYCAHVRSNLEYASVVWFPGCANKVNSIESIQKKFVLFALRRSIRRDLNYRLPSYESRCKLLNLESLVRRRLNTCALFAYDILNSILDAPVLRIKFSLNSTMNHLRARDCLLVPQHRTLYGFFEPVTNLSRIYNNFYRMIDLNASASNRSLIKSLVISDVMQFAVGMYVL